jgi:putative transposase
MCEVLGVSTSGYYEWRSRPPSEREVEVVDHDLLRVIRDIWERSQKTYGAPPSVRERGHVLRV